MPCAGHTLSIGGQTTIYGAGTAVELLCLPPAPGAVEVPRMMMTEQGA